MPQGNDIASKIAGAKSALAHAEKSFPSSMAPASSRLAPVKTTVPKVAPVASPKPVGGGMTWGTAGYQEGVDTLPKLHKGGIVKKTAAYKMQKGEGVVPAKAMKGMKAGIRALASKGAKK